MKVIILAGGGGTRLFPLSRTCFPKQFMKLDGERTLLAQTAERFLSAVAPKDIVVVTNQEYLHHVETELANSDLQQAHIILEPVGRNTAPAIALAVQYCMDELQSEPDEVLIVTPSDHVIRGAERFEECVRQAAELAQQEKVVTFGIRPDKPETGYGYIETSDAINGGGYAVASFKEKPDLPTAQRYVKEERYYWNSGMFAFTAKCIQTELANFQPEIAALTELGYAQALQRFAEMPQISIDYAVAEKSKRVVMVPLTAYWNDIGSWDAIYDVMHKDEAGNAIQGDCLAIGCSNMLMIGKSRLIAGIGLEDVLVVETDDVIVVAKKGESQKVKDLVGELRLRGRKEPDEHTTIYREWGSHSVLGEGPGYRMRKIIVKPGKQLSLQMHYHRSEHWIVTAGTAQVKVGDDVRMLHENESAFIPMTTKHQLKNPGKIPLEIIEVQNGKYLEEDDIVRFNAE